MRPSGGVSQTGPGPRTRVRRLAERARYDRADVYAILDEGFVCHVGVSVDGAPAVLPTTYVRVGDQLYLHGAPANAVLGGALDPAPVCVTVTLVDGLVLARSAFHHSINYRSVVVYGQACDVTNPEEKRRALDLLVDHILPGRAADTRPPYESELRATRVVRVPIEEASAKVRVGPPKEEPEDLELTSCWAGELPVRLVAQAPVPDPAQDPSTPVPSYVSSHPRLGVPTG